MKTFIKWVAYVCVLQVIFTVCGPHFVVGGILWTLASKAFKTSSFAVAQSEPARLSSHSGQASKV